MATLVSSNPRYRVQRSLQASLPTDTDGGFLSEGFAQLHSFSAPSLEWGTYSVTATNDIATSTNEHITLKNNLAGPQQFSVIIPQFSLPAGSFHSCYPPLGMAVPPKILPHIVFNDAQLPWECEVSPPDPNGLGQTPWLALLAFQQDELRLSSNDMSNIFASINVKPERQSAMFSVTLSANDFLRNTHSIVPNLLQASGELDPKIDPQDSVEAIFLTTELFTALFNMYDENGQLSSPPPHTAFVDRYRELAHVRNVSTVHMADAGTEDVGQFSVVLSHRTGPLNVSVPTDIIVHLVSLEGVQKIALPIDPKFSRVGLASLYSWSYKCLPQGSFSLEESFKNIGAQAAAFLRVDDQTLSRLATNPSQEAMHNRLAQGYSLVRYRTQTGDETVAFTRGPLTPVRVPHPPLDNWPGRSNSGTDLQILDTTIGIMDITYSAAWQLGRSLAIANPVFRTALTRLRSTIHDTAVRNVKAALAGVAYRTQANVISSLNNTKDMLANLHMAKVVSQSRSSQKNLTVIARFSLGDSNTKNMYVSEVSNIARQIAAGKPPGTAQFDQTQGNIYNEMNVPENSDWGTIFAFILDRLFLSGIPAHYLITDPNHLPDESIRFFYVDENWIDALIDGTLSLANHLQNDDDDIRRAIKDNINAYLQTPLEPTGHLPQIPRFGFFLRSSIVNSYPDLKVTSPLPAGDKRTPTPFLQRVADDVLLCMFDRMPNDVDFTSITLQQPPHQLSFAIGSELTPTELQISPRHVWTIKVPPGQDPAFSPIVDIVYKTGQGANATSPVIYDWKYNTMIMTNYVPWIKKWLWDHQADHFGNQDIFNPTKPTYIDKASSALVGIQLNDWLWYLTINAANIPGTNTSPPRQLWIGPNANVEPPMTKRVFRKPENVLRPPNLPRIRLNDSSYENIPASTLPFPIQLVSVGLFGQLINNQIQVVDDAQQVLVISVEFKPDQGKPVSEYIIEIPVDVQDVHAAPSTDVPLLAAVDGTKLNVGKGVVGNGQAWLNVALEQTNKSVLLRFIPKKPGQGSREKTVTVLLREAILAGKAGRALLPTTTIWLSPEIQGGKSASKDIFEVAVI